MMYKHISEYYLFAIQKLKH